MPSRLQRKANFTIASMPRRQIHHLRSERRRLALTQTDIAALLGGSRKARISRYERGLLPPTEIVLAYEAILGQPVAVLLGGVYQEVAFNVRRRARELLLTAGVASTPKHLRRRRSLERIAG